MKITFISGDMTGRSFEYSDCNITIGREPDNTLCLETGGVSRYHALISYLDNSWSISDLNSTNGVKINSVLQASSKLTNGDVVTIGEHSFTISDIVSSGKVVTPVVTIPGEQNSAETVAEDTSILDKFKAPLFSPDADGEKSDDPKPEQTNKKRIFSNRLYYTVIACIAIMGITTAVKVFSNKNGSVSEKSGAGDEQLETIIFERVRYYDNNVFRFTMTLDGRKAVFVIDDVATNRHSKEIVIDDPAGADTLRSQILETGIMTEKQSFQPGSPNVSTKITLISDRNCVDYKIEGEALPKDLDDIASAIDEFAESCGMITVSRTSEEIMQIAAENFHKAEDLFNNSEAAEENLRDAILRYKIAVRYLSQYSPPPPMATKAMRQLIRAEEIRKRKLDELKLAENRCLDTNQLDELRNVYLKMIKLSDTGTRAFDRTKRKLFKLDRALSRGRNRR